MDGWLCNNGRWGNEYLGIKSLFTKGESAVSQSRWIRRMGRRHPSKRKSLAKAGREEVQVCMRNSKASTFVTCGVHI